MVCLFELSFGLELVFITTLVITMVELHNHFDGDQMNAESLVDRVVYRKNNSSSQIALETLS